MLSRPSRTLHGGLLRSPGTLIEEADQATKEAIHGISTLGVVGAVRDPVSPEPTSTLALDSTGDAGFRVSPLARQSGGDAGLHALSHPSQDITKQLSSFNTPTESPGVTSDSEAETQAADVSGTPSRVSVADLLKSVGYVPSPDLDRRIDMLVEAKRKHDLTEDMRAVVERHADTAVNRSSVGEKRVRQPLASMGIGSPKSSPLIHETTSLHSFSNNSMEFSEERHDLTEKKKRPATTLVQRRRWMAVETNLRARPHPRSTWTLQFQAVYQRPQLAPPRRNGREARRSRLERARTRVFRLRMKRIPSMLHYPRLFLRLKLFHIRSRLRRRRRMTPWLNPSSTDTAYMRVMGV